MSMRRAARRSAPSASRSTNTGGSTSSPAGSVIVDIPSSVEVTDALSARARERAPLAARHPRAEPHLRRTGAGRLSGSLAAAVTAPADPRCRSRRRRERPEAVDHERLGVGAGAAVLVGDGRGDGVRSATAHDAARCSPERPDEQRRSPAAAPVDRARPPCRARPHRRSRRPPSWTSVRIRTGRQRERRGVGAMFCTVSVSFAEPADRRRCSR